MANLSAAAKRRLENLKKNKNKKKSPELPPGFPKGTNPDSTPVENAWVAIVKKKHSKSKG